jgi:peptide/nickel transport system ATP-binding protein
MLQLDNLIVDIDTDAGLLRAIDGLQLSLARGETFALVGESGCGKSLTAQTLMRLLPPSARIHQGSLQLGAQDLFTLPEAQMRSIRGGRLGMIFQEPATSLNPVMTIGAQLLEAITAHTPLRGAAARERALHWLGKVGIPQPTQRLGDYPFRLSGGQKQRVMIAMALAGEPDFLIADEPTTALDVTTQAQILDLLQGLQREQKMGLLLITHDLAVVARMAHHVALMYAGQIVELAPAIDFFQNPQHPYAHLLVGALPSAAKRGTPLAAIAGSVPVMTEPFHGCRFAPRCPQALPSCASTIPPMRSGAHAVRCVLPDAPVWAAPSSSSSAPPEPRAFHGPALFQLQNLRVNFPSSKGPVTVVDGISFDVHAGETLALVGESGCGKTTTGRALMQLLRGQAQVEGQALLGGQDLFTLQGAALRQMRKNIQIIFQDPFASLNPRMRVDEILLEGLQALRPELSAAARQKKIDTLVDQVGLRRDALRRWPHEFSGGQRQRIAIARALAVEPQLLVCDEPTSALDVSIQAQIVNLLRSLQQELQISYIFITHNVSIVGYIADRIVVMQQGKIQETGLCSTVLTDPQSPYTQNLLRACAPHASPPPTPASPKPCPH